MRYLLAITMILFAGLSVSAGNKTLTSDPLTGLPLIPWPDRLQLGNPPQKLPQTNMCKSVMQMDFYSPNGIQVGATIAWYAAHLTGFKKTHAYVNGRSQDLFYKPDGSMFVSVTGSPTPGDGMDSETFGLVYATLQPSISEKTIIGMNSQKIVCQ